MASNTPEMLRLIDSISRDRNVEKETLFTDIEQALVSAARKHFNALETDEFRRRVAEIVATDHWVIDGNYSRVRDIVLTRVTHVVAFDLPLPVMVWRIAYRTLGRRLGWRGVTPLPAQVHADGEPLIAATIALSQNAVKYKRGHLRRILAQVAEAGIPADAVRVVTTTGGVMGVVEALASERAG